MDGVFWLADIGVTAEERPRDLILPNSANVNHTSVCCGHVSPRKAFLLCLALRKGLRL